MTELYRHVGADIDVPAGDIGVGAREIGYMFGQYKRITNEFTGVLTGKGLEYGGSLIRTEATGYGAIYFLQNMLERVGNSIDGKTCVISGSGNVATHAAEKINHLGGKVLTLSDSAGFIHDPDGIDPEKVDWVKQHKTKRRGRIADYVKEFKGAKFYEGKRPWGVKCDLAMPCATENELNGEDAKTLIKNGCIAVAEGANMPTDLDGVHVFKDAKILFAPGKAANAGGVAVSGLEMSQNSARISWKEEELQTAADRHHEGHPRFLRRIRRHARQRAHRLCAGRQHRRLQEGGRRDAGLRGGLTGAASPACQRERDDAELTANVDCKVRGGSASPLCHIPSGPTAIATASSASPGPPPSQWKSTRTMNPSPRAAATRAWSRLMRIVSDVGSYPERCSLFPRFRYSTLKSFRGLRRLSSLFPIRSTALSPAGRDAHVRPHPSWGSVT